MILRHLCPHCTGRLELERLGRGRPQRDAGWCGRCRLIVLLDEAEPVTSAGQPPDRRDLA